jgi:hypothetical protein
VCARTCVSVCFCFCVCQCIHACCAPTLCDGDACITYGTGSEKIAERMTYGMGSEKTAGDGHVTKGCRTCRHAWPPSGWESASRIGHESVSVRSPASWGYVSGRRWRASVSASCVSVSARGGGGGRGGWPLWLAASRAPALHVGLPCCQGRVVWQVC